MPSHHNPLTLSEVQALVQQRPNSKLIADLLFSGRLFALPQMELDKERLHAEVVDRLLGYRIKEIEAQLLKAAQKRCPHGDVSQLGRALHQGRQTWVGLNPRALQTPYAQLWRVLRSLAPRPGQLVVDLGAAYGRMGLILRSGWPQVFFLGLEFVPERVEEGNRIYALYNMPRAKLLHQDLGHKAKALPRADYYFLYDYGRNDHLQLTLDQLKSSSSERSFYLIICGTVAVDLMNSSRYRSMITSAKEGQHYGIYHCRAIASAAQLG